MHVLDLAGAVERLGRRVAGRAARPARRPDRARTVRRPLTGHLMSGSLTGHLTNGGPVRER